MNKKNILKMISVVLLITMFAYTTPVLAYTKDETVYSKLDTKGNKYNTIVNSHIKNKEQKATINDVSDLLNIKNVNGNEEFSQDGNLLVWNAGGNDIYYQGESQKDLPVECNIKYELDGQEISTEELAGKSGKVKITIEYINKDEHMVNINGKDEKLYTPFVVVCGTIINNDNNRNIEVTNGKVIDDGSKTTVVGMSLPGLEESLNISDKNIDIPNIIEITMDSTDFQLNNIVSFITPKMIDKTDVDIFKKLDEIYSKANALQSSSNQLTKGANSLKSGTDMYSEKSKEFNLAMNEVAKGVSSANKSYSKVNVGIATLNENAGIIKSSAKSLSDGTEAISTNLNIIDEKLGELQTGTKKLQEGEENLNKGLEKIILSVNDIQITDNSAKIKELKQLVATNENTIKTLKTANTNLTEQLNNVKDETIKKAIKTQIETNKSLISLLETNVKADKETIDTLQTIDTSSIEQLKTGLKALEQGFKELQEGTKKLYNGETELKAGTETLASKTQELSQGSKQLYQGTIQISEGTKELNTGSNEMKKGLDTLDQGTGALTDASNQLTDGANTLSENVTLLSEGISQLDKEGIGAICNYINGDVKDITTRLEKLEELANEYNNFTMLEDGENGNVKFIMIMDSIKKEENGKQEIIIDDRSKENN